MKEQVIKDGQGREVQVLSDGKTVWVNGHLGALIGRFSRFGIDIHAQPGSEEHCLDCRPAMSMKHIPGFGLPSRADWHVFVRSMMEHHEVQMPDGESLIDEWLEGPYIIRYVITHNTQGTRTLAFPKQGRYTHETEEEAQRSLDLFRGGLERSLGYQNLEVRPVECWPGHFDPKTRWFETEKV